MICDICDDQGRFVRIQIFEGFCEFVNNDIFLTTFAIDYKFYYMFLLQIKNFFLSLYHIQCVSFHLKHFTVHFDLSQINMFYLISMGIPLLNRRQESLLPKIEESRFLNCEK